MRSFLPSRRLSALWLCALLAMAGVGLAACSPKSPEERVADLRRQYNAELNSFVVEETPLEPAAGEEEMAGEGEEMAGEEMAGEAGDGEGMDAMGEPVEVRKDVVLDILVQNRATEPLAGLTLDIGLVDPGKNEKAHYRHWVDTSNLLKGRGESFIHRIEDVPYEEGDAFYVEIRTPVPAAERGEYREFAMAGEGG